MVPVLRKVDVDTFGDRVMVVADDPVSREAVIVETGSLHKKRSAWLLLLNPEWSFGQRNSFSV